MAGFVDRMIGAAKLEVSTYEEVERDRTALGQAMGVVVLSSLAAGIGSSRAGAGGLVAVAAASLLGWFVWGWLTYVIGTRLLPEPSTRADLGELLRTIGFSASPGILRVLGFLPLVGGLLSFAAGVWMLAAMVVAVRQALDYTSTARALGVCAAGWLVYVLIGLLLASLFGGGSLPAR